MANSNADTSASQVLLPVLVARLNNVADVRALVLTALTGKVTSVPIDQPPVDDGVHSLELHAPGLVEPFVVSAMPVGELAAGALPVQLCPLDEAELRRVRTFLELCTRDRDSLIGTVLGGRYRIDASLGHGAMGSVYRAHHITLDKPIAVKVLNASLRDDPSFAARFLAEARAASRLDHPGILRVLDFGEEGALLYMVMELLEGETLEEEAARGPFPIERALDVVARIADALGVAHAHGVVHRDIKPENVMIAGDRVVVCDFGIAQTNDQSSRLTIAGNVCGTPEYMAPEQARGEHVGPAADVYSAGIILFRLLTERVPFERATPIATAIAHLTDPFPRAADLRPDLPARVQQALDRICARQTADRPANGAELAALLRACREEELAHQEFDARYGSGPRPVPGAKLLAALDGNDDLVRIQAIAGLRRLGSIDREAVTKLAQLFGPTSGESLELRVAATAAMIDVQPAARAAAIDALDAALIPRSGGVLGMMNGGRNDELVLETIARVLVDLAGDEGRRRVAQRALRAKPSMRPRLEALVSPVSSRRIA